MILIGILPGILIVTSGIYYLYILVHIPDK